MIILQLNLHVYHPLKKFIHTSNCIYIYFDITISKSNQIKNSNNLKNCLTRYHSKCHDSRNKFIYYFPFSLKNKCTLIRTNAYLILEFRNLQMITCKKKNPEAGIIITNRYTIFYLKLRWHYILVRQMFDVRNK